MRGGQERNQARGASQERRNVRQLRKKVCTAYSVSAEEAHCHYEVLTGMDNGVMEGLRVGSRGALS